MKRRKSLENVFSVSDFLHIHFSTESGYTCYGYDWFVHKMKRIHIRWLTYHKCCQNDKLHTHSPHSKRESCDHLFCHINCQSHDKRTHTRKSGRLRFTGHIETKQAFAIHNKMIYHFCIKRFATLPFWLWAFCIALLKTVFSFVLFVSFAVSLYTYNSHHPHHHQQHHHLRSTKFRISTAKRIHCHTQRTRIIKTYLKRTAIEEKHANNKQTNASLFYFDLFGTFSSSQRDQSASKQTSNNNKLSMCHFND